MGAVYRDLLDQIRRCFPQPISDTVHDAYFVISILRALDQVDEMKSEIPVLGQPPQVAATAAGDDWIARLRLANGTKPLVEVTRELVDRLQGIFIWGHPRTQVNVVATPSIAGIIGALLPIMYNPNLCSEETSHRIGRTELEVAAILSNLIGYDAAQSGGCFTFGGTGTLLYAGRIGLEKAQPGSMRDGISPGAVLLASDCSHSARYNVASWLGIGERAVISVPCRGDNSMSLADLDRMGRDQLAAGKKIALVIATVGTTDAFGLDDVEGVVRIRDEWVRHFRLPYQPHVHADAVIGWAWSVFNDYEFERNPLGFRPSTLRALALVGRQVRQLKCADSLGVDFHKTGFAPYISSLFLARDRSDLALLARSRELMPYLFQTGGYHPGGYTLETSRSGTGPMAALANLLLLGRDGFRALLGHLVEMAEVLRDHLGAHSATTVLNTDNFGTVTLFRAYPDGVDTFTVKEREMSDPNYQDAVLRHNRYNRRIFELVHEEAMQGRGVAISMTDCYRTTNHGLPINALKSYILSPFADEAHVAAVVAKVAEAREMVGREGGW